MYIHHILGTIHTKFLHRKLNFPRLGWSLSQVCFSLSYSLCVSTTLSVSSLHAVSLPGDGEGGIEMTGSMQLIREFCDEFIAPEKSTRTRIVRVVSFCLCV